jgi:hypothetical protein
MAQNLLPLQSFDDPEWILQGFLSQLQKGRTIHLMHSKGISILR